MIQLALAAVAGVFAGGLLHRWALGHRAASPPAQLLELIHDGVLVLGRGSAVLWANGPAFRLLGLEPSGDRDRLRAALLRNTQLRSFIDAVGTDVEIESVNVEVGFPSVRQLRVQASRVGAPVAGWELVLTLTDVSRVEQLERVRRQFTADLAHEIRTPVTSISLLAETIDQADDPSGHAEHILRETRRLQQLVDQVLSLSRLEAGETDLRPARFPVAELVAEAVDALGSRSADRHVEVVVELQGEPPDWWGDRAQILKILKVYLDNALKYSPAGGVIRLCARREGEWNVLSVTDAGPGIPVEEQPHVFRRFYKGRRQSETPGFGLGLAIAKHAALAHGGDVFVTSQVGEGSTFGLRLPLPPE